MQASRRILLSHLYFPPAAKPYGLMLRYIAERLAAEGHKVSLFASCDPSGKEDNEAIAHELAAAGIGVTRVAIRPARGMRGKLSGALRYVAALCRHIVRTRPEIVTVASFPPLFAAFAVAVAGRLAGSKVVYHVQDIHPEITAPKLPRILRPFYRFVGAFMNAATLRLVHGVITLSPDMRDILVERGAPAERTICLNNLSLSSLEPGSGPPETEVRSSGEANRFEIVFAGNMGAFQALEEVAAFVSEAARIPEITFTFVGDGVRREWLQRALSGLEPSKVSFLPFMPFADLAPILDRAQMGLVSLDDASVRYAYPSKIPTYLSMGLPLLCIFDRSSGLAREVEENGLAIVADAASREGALEALSRLAAAFDLQVRMQENARIYFAREFSPESYISRLNSFFGEI